MLLKALGGGSRLLRLILENLESLVELVEEEEELLGGVSLSLLSIHTMSEGESGKEKKGE